MPTEILSLRADDEVQVISDIDIQGSATIDKVLPTLLALVQRLILDTVQKLPLGTSSSSTTVGKIYYYDGSTWQAFSSSTEVAQKLCWGISRQHDGFWISFKGVCTRGL